MVSRLVGHGERGGVSKLIAGADNEVFEVVFRDEVVNARWLRFLAFRFLFECAAFLQLLVHCHRELNVLLGENRQGFLNRGEKMLH